MFESLFSWMTGLLVSLGLWKKKASVLIVGLDNAGKSTLLRRLVQGDMSALPPTTHCDKQEIRMGSLRILAYDVGGHPQMRRLWPDYLYATNAVIFVVDSSDMERLPETKHELQGLLSVGEAAEVPVLVLGNKIDRPDALSPTALQSYLGLDGVVTGKGAVSRDSLAGRRPLEVFMCSMLRQTGYADALTWLAQYL